MRMNNRLLAYTLLLLLVVTSACERKYEAPLVTEPKVEGVTSNISIADFKQKYAHVPDRGNELIDVNYVLKGTVVGNDTSGNIYKEIYIQDKTGGIKIGVDQNNVAGDYYIGQEVFVKLHGLSAVRYAGQLQVGMANTQANRIPYEIFKEKVLRNGWPLKENAKPKVITMDEFGDHLVGMLVQLDEVYFEGKGELTFADAETLKTLNRQLYNAKGQSIVVRNSGYADFAADKMPDGHGSVRGIFSKFGNTYQLLLRSKEDVFNFVSGLPSNTGGTSDKPNTGGINIGGGGETEKPEVTGKLLFPSAHFNDWAAFEKSLNKKFRLVMTAESKDGGIDGSGAAHLKGKGDKNGYFFTAVLPEKLEATGAKKITFFLKGTVKGRSISVNVFNTNEDIKYDDKGTLKPAGYVTYNLGDLTSAKSYKASTKNGYDGSISLSHWTKITLELVTDDGKPVILPTEAGKDIIAFKFGRNATYDILLDEIRFE